VTCELASMSDHGFGALKANLFAIATNLLPAKANFSAARSGFSVTPAYVCVADRAFFVAPMFLVAAENIVLSAEGTRRLPEVFPDEAVKTCPAIAHRVEMPLRVQFSGTDRCVDAHSIKV
jgi:hypothetical protein